MKNQTMFFKTPVEVSETATIVGPKEGEGPLGKYFHHILKDDLFKQKSHETAEYKMHEAVIQQLLNRSKLSASDISCVFAGDLLDEIVGSSLALREHDIPFMGVYNACASIGEALILGAAMLEAGLMDKTVCSTTSHFSTAERQYRFPLELGSQRTPLSQWTVTAGAAILLTRGENSVAPNPKITCATVGRVIDFGIDDANDMGAAMAPAALSTITAHLADTGREASYYDLILTGDLGHAGSRLLTKLAGDKGIRLEENYSDCGILIYNREAQKVGQGGSGACCGNAVFSAYIYKLMREGKYKKVLFVPTGALLSKTSSLQGESIPGIAHAVALEMPESH